MVSICYATIVGREADAAIFTAVSIVPEIPLLPAYTDVASTAKSGIGKPSLGVVHAQPLKVACTQPSATGAGYAVAIALKATE